MNIMPQIIPIKDLRDTTKISELCHNSNGPVYVTKNGYGDMVIMSISAFEGMTGMKGAAAKGFPEAKNS